ncbi:MAG: tyrosine-protein phosphatase [Gemmataceae bacterium]
MSRRFVKLSILGLALGLVLAFAAEASSVLIGHNLHTVIPGSVYRCAQPSADEVRRDVAKYGIKTLINLRGCNANGDWYLSESRAGTELDIAQEDVTFSAGRLPDPVEMRRLVEVLDRAEHPVLIHCRRGVDRTGLTSAIVQMLYAGVSPPEARQQLSYRYGHFPWGRTAAMLRFFDLYDRWLAANGSPHSPEKFREFVTTGYCPGPARGIIELAQPIELVAGKAGVVHLRTTNLSNEDWHMKASTGVGIHVHFRIDNATGAEVQIGDAGSFAATVSPGSSITVMLPINRLPSAGRYILHADLLDGPDIAFSQLGGDEFVTEFIAR